MTASKSQTTGRGRLRSRLRFGALALGMILIAGCADHFGPGLVQLAAGRGWEPLPIQNWVVNDGINPKAMVFCTPQDCERPGVAALLSFEGSEAADMARTLALNPARLAREFSKRPKAKRAEKPKSTTTVSRFKQDGTDGILVEIRARDGGRLAATAILYARKDTTLSMAIAVTDDSQAAQDFARATWASR
ncbi:hypothetical protein SAMN04515666_11753 [Bosea lupini]|uniref:Uncharacterized protein n=1 Tax=Bosea lupini TaxID=1036779 RepID=A0A1H8A3Y7_9HYPH|nr:hypothetical protein SAMN04515666_11753 [Bosea lupini]